MPVSAVNTDRFARLAEDTAAAERKIQQEIGRRERARPKEKKARGAMQAGGDQDGDVLARDAAGF